MPNRRMAIAGATPAAVASAAAALQSARDELQIKVDFPTAVIAEVQQLVGEAGDVGEVSTPIDGPSGTDRTRADRTRIPLVTVDPEGSMDLDQAVHIEQTDTGFTVFYAIADVSSVVTPGGPLDLETRVRGLTFYGPDAKAPLHPAILSEGTASLLPGQRRRAALWTLRLGVAGELIAATIERAWVQSRAQLTYEQVQESVDANPQPGRFPDLLRTVGQLRLERQRLRGGVSLEVPEQEVTTNGNGELVLKFRAVLPVESWNAQISLLTGIAAARLMVTAGIGILRTVPQASDGSIARLRRTALALGLDWPDGKSYSDVLSGLDRADPKSAVFLTEATSLFRGGGYLAFGMPGAPAPERLPQEATHAAIASHYAHVTAPLRRLVDRYGQEICLAICAGEQPPTWVLEALPSLPDIMATASTRSGKYQRAGLDIIEAALLSGREGEAFPAKLTEEDVVVLEEFAVKARVPRTTIPIGSVINVRLDSVDIMSRQVVFSVVGY